jgi:hypothetical protein
VVRAPTFFLLRDLMVALLQNSQTRTDQAVQHKLNAIADGLADPELMAHIDSGGHGRDLQQDLIELRSAVELESHESTSSNRADDASSR